MQFNIIFKTIFKYIHKKFRFVHTNTLCKYRKKLLASPRVHLVNFTEVSEKCIDSIIKNMKSKSSTGYDNISNKLIKSAKDVLIKSLTLLMNQIIHTGEFPKQLKIAKVKPLFKKGNQSSFTNYRHFIVAFHF